MTKQNRFYGSVRIFKVTGEDIIYTHQFFNDEIPQYRNMSQIIATFHKVNAIKYDKKIEELCYKASKREIPKSKLIEKLNELFTENVNKTRINK